MVNYMNRVPAGVRTTSSFADQAPLLRLEYFYEGLYFWLRRRYAQLLTFSQKGGSSLKSRALISLAGGVAWLTLSLLLIAMWGEMGILAATALTLTVALYLTISVFAKMNDLATKRIHDERNQQALLAIYSAISPKVPLPYFRNAALSSDTCLDYIRLIRRVRPQTIVELGSGTSTVISALTVKQIGNGRVIALEHDEKWASSTRQTITEHNLENWADVRLAPLNKLTIEGKTHEWYDQNAIKDIQEIDILLIDGPPDHYGLGKRYPALPVMEDLISEAGYIIIDDCIMPKWENIVLKWASKHGFHVESPYLNEKKALFLHRTPRQKSQTHLSAAVQ